MGLFGRNTPDLQNWDTCVIQDDFTTTGVASGFVASGVAARVGQWQPGPFIPGGAGETSGVLFQAQSGQLGGVAKLTAGAVAAGEGYAWSVPETFALVSGGSLYAKARVRLDEITSGALQAFFGFASAPQQSGILLNGGLRTSGNVVGLVKTSGQGNWALAGNVQTSGLLVQAANAPVGGNLSGNFQTLEVFANTERGNVQISAKVNGIYLKQHTTDVQPLTLTFPADGTAMSVGFGIRQGASEASTLSVDKVHAQQSHDLP